jgi:REP element-mobilizing transposase RayT
MIRGVEKRPIFSDDLDRRIFLDRFERQCVALRFRCFSWALLPNHAHFVLKTGDVALAQLMARTTSVYAHFFNRRHARVGHLFQGRYRARPIASDADLLAVVLYVALNPARHGLIAARELARFPWCAYGALLGCRPARPFESISDALRLFGEEPTHARSRLADWASRRLQDPADADPAVILRQRLNAILAEMGAGAEPAQLRGRRPAAQRALEHVCTRAVDEGFRGNAIARAIGVSPQAVSRALARAKRNSGV